MGLNYDGFDLTAPPKVSGQKPETAAGPTEGQKYCHRDKLPCIGPSCVKFIFEETEEGDGIMGDCSELIADESQARFYEVISENLETWGAEIMGIISSSLNFKPRPPTDTDPSKRNPKPEEESEEELKGEEESEDSEEE